MVKFFGSGSRIARFNFPVLSRQHTLPWRAAQFCRIFWRPVRRTGPWRCLVRPASQERSGSLGGGKGKLDRTLQLFRELTHNTASLVHGKHDEDDEDPEYLKVCVPRLVISSSSCNEELRVEGGYR